MIRGAAILVALCCGAFPDRWATASGVAAETLPPLGAEWVAIPHDSTRPPTLGHHEAVYDPLRDRLLVFGSPGVPSLQVWELPLDGPPHWRFVATNSPPSARAGMTAVHDPIRDRVICYGGGTTGNELWSFDLADVPKWTLLSPGGGAPPGRRHHSMVYDPSRDRMLVFGGVAPGSGVFLQDTWALDLAGPGHWTQLTAGAPAPRYGHAAIYDPVRDRMVIHAGVGGFTPFSDVYALSLSGTPTWTQISGSLIRPAGRRYHAAVYDAGRDAMVIFGGDGNSSERHGDTWALSLASNVWSGVHAGSPGVRTAFAWAYDSRRSRLLMTGGEPYGQDCWGLDLSEVPRWSQLSPVGSATSPTGRYLHAAAYDPSRDRLLVHGGFSADGDGAKLWALGLDGAPAWSAVPTDQAPEARLHQAVYDAGHDRLLLLGGTVLHDRVPVLPLAGPPVWSSLIPGGTVPGRRNRPSAIYDPVRDRILMFGGYIDNAFGDRLTFDTLWELSLGATPTWTRLAPLGPIPPSRAEHSAIYDPERDRMVVFGGYTSSFSTRLTVLADIWELDLSGTPTWKALAPAGAGPGPRSGHSAVLDSVADQMLVHSWPTADSVWVLSLGSDERWEVLVPRGGPPPRRYAHVAGFDPDDDRMVLFGGREGVYLIEDAWELKLDRPPGPPGAVAGVEGPASIALSWAPSNSPEVAGYRIYYGRLDDRPPLSGSGAAEGSSGIHVSTGQTSFNLTCLPDTWFQVALASVDQEGRTGRLSPPVVVRPLRPAARVKLAPALNQDSQGNFVSCRIELDPPFSISNLDLDSIQLEGSVPALPRFTRLVNVAGQAQPFVETKFDRQRVLDLFSANGPRAVTVTALYRGCEDILTCEGRDTVSILAAQTGGVVEPGVGAGSSDAELAASGAGADDDASGTVEASVTDFELAATPNPLQGPGRVTFAIPWESRIRLRVLDIQGREVHALAEGRYRPGRHSIAWNASAMRRLAAGLYLLHLEIPGRSFVHKIVVCH